MPDWFIAVLLLLAWIDGFVIAWAISHENVSGLWRGYLDGRTLRLLWRR